MKWVTEGIKAYRGTAGPFLAVPVKPQDADKLAEDTVYTVEIKKYREKRSLSANAYCWVLCQGIAKELSKDGAVITKEDVYRQVVHQYGDFSETFVSEDKVKRFIRDWQNNGYGWLAVESGICAERDGKRYVGMFLYAGSSTYNTEEMSRLIEGLTDMAMELGVDTRDPAEVASMLEAVENE